MESASLLLICLSAFAAVFVVLAILALVMRLILIAFPDKKPLSEAAVLAAVSSTVQIAIPGTTVTKIEEIK